MRKEMEERGCRLLLHTGDWAAFRQRQLRRTFEMFREILGPEVIIAAVKGNHDCWQDRREGEQYTLAEMIDLHKQWAEEFGISLLNGQPPLLVEDVHVVGFDGWYAHPQISSLTNDVNWMPSQIGLEVSNLDVHDYMRKRAQICFEMLLNWNWEGIDRKKVIGLTHMPLLEGDFNGNPNWFPFMADKCGTICFGHSHQKMDTVMGETHVYNAGAVYGSIRYNFIEV